MATLQAKWGDGNARDRRSAEKSVHLRSTGTTRTDRSSAAHNPQQFLEQAQQAIDAELHRLMLSGIKYGKINGQEHEMRLFEEREIFGTNLNKVLVENSIYEELFVDSEVERAFAEAMSMRDDIKLFIKLPWWFLIETPLGNYNPDWAIVSEDDTKIYLVRGTKSTLDQLKPRGSEWAKIQCGKAHFDALEVDFQPVCHADEI